EPAAWPGAFSRILGTPAQTPHAVLNSHIMALSRLGRAAAGDCLKGATAMVKNLIQTLLVISRS
ncbi:hypothetical protein, partial [Mesorhizobium sp.]|uniref:hypothetical protein n=1 Tax=Mesorhizobium sp. TaxID=1871066 RepID=UPI0025BB1B42